MHGLETIKAMNIRAPYKTVQQPNGRWATVRQSDTKVVATHRDRRAAVGRTLKEITKVKGDTRSAFTRAQE